MFFLRHTWNNGMVEYWNVDLLVKSPGTVMPDPGSSPGQALIRHPEILILLDSGFRRNDVLERFSTFYEFINVGFQRKFFIYKNLKLHLSICILPIARP